MQGLCFPVMKTLYKKKESKICLLFSLLPLMLIITSILPSNFMQLNGDVGSMSCMEFFEAVLNVQFQMVLPSIAFMHLITIYIHDDIKNGCMYLYKDIPRKKVYLCKTMSLLTLYIVYFVCTFITSVFTYYVYVIKQPYASGTFFPLGLMDTQYITVSIVGIMLAFVISIMLVVVLSLFFNNSMTLIIGILFVLFNSIASLVEKINILFPTGYASQIEKNGFIPSILGMLFISIIYIAVIGLVGKYKIKRIEF